MAATLAGTGTGSFEGAVAWEDPSSHSACASLIASSASAFAMRKGDPDALNFFNNWILYHNLDGWLEGAHDKWFEGRNWKSKVD